MAAKKECSVPQIKVEEVLLNANNPFKKKLTWRRLRCSECNEIVLGRGISSQEDWDKVRRHLKDRHGIIEDEGIPIRLLSLPLFRRWLKLQMKKVKR